VTVMIQVHYFDPLKQETVKLPAMVYWSGGRDAADAQIQVLRETYPDNHIGAYCWSTEFPEDRPYGYQKPPHIRGSPKEYR
jgi:hypothetical protein